MTTILVKNVSERLEKKLRTLKAELGCRTWAELLGKLVECEGARGLGEGRLSEMKMGVEGFLQLRTKVSDEWKGRTGVLEEIRKSRSHDRA